MVKQTPKTQEVTKRMIYDILIEMKKESHIAHNTCINTNKSKQGGK